MEVIAKKLDESLMAEALGLGKETENPVVSRRKHRNSWRRSRAIEDGRREPEGGD